MNIQLVLAQEESLAEIMSICDSARRYQRDQGFIQWLDNYPSIEIISDDIAASRGYIVSDDDEPVGYCVIDFNGEPEYDIRPGIWSTDAPYAAIHRLAFNDKVRGKGICRQLLGLIESRVISAGINVIKADTGACNIKMRHILESAGFSDKGEQQFLYGPRIAFEKIIS